MPLRFVPTVCLAVYLATSLFLPNQARAEDRSAPPAGEATSYPAVDTHPDEQVSIAVDPYNTSEKISLFRVNYLKNGLLPIRIIVTNNSDHPISLANARINFITAAQDKIATSEILDVERRVIPVSRPDGAKTPISILSGNKAVKMKKAIEADFAAFEYSAVTVAPHSTQSGFFFYDVEDLENPLVGARLSAISLTGAGGKELFSFEISFDKYLAASKGK